MRVGDYPNGFDAAADLVASRDSFIKGVNGTLVSTRRIDFHRGSQTLPALEFDASFDNKVVRGINVADGAREYMVAGVALKGSGREADINQCLDGVTLLPRQ